LHFANNGPINELLQTDDGKVYFSLGNEILELKSFDGKYATNHITRLINDISEIKVSGDVMLVAHGSSASIIVNNDVHETFTMESPVTSIGFDEENNWLSATSLDGYLYLFQCVNGKWVQSLKEHYRSDFEHQQIYSHEWIKSDVDELVIVLGGMIFIFYFGKLFIIYILIGNFRSLFFIKIDLEELDGYNDIKKSWLIHFARDPICQSVGQIIKVDQENDLFAMLGLGLFHPNHNIIVVFIFILIFLRWFGTLQHQKNEGSG